ncbi:MAG: eukaryotic-like serine/threonine-protein kinase [Actinomycetota bacterium]|nr:eukaryotic-like serine/threonine-protein kinase [Actinomycetota bacterium]
MQTLRDDRLLGGRYRIGRLLGRGGMAEVYEGFDERLHRNVAVKVLRPEMAAVPEVRRRFEAEARSAARLSHPNVVAIFDTGEDGDVPYLVMEQLPGETLADRMQAGRVDEGWLLRVAGDVLLALGAAHAAGIVHRDVKPGNILLAADGCAKVADFGIAKSLDVAAAADLTNTDQLVGTPAYVAPERVAGEPATPLSDLYAMGVVLYEALAGAKPFEGNTPVAIAYAIRHERPTPLAERRPDLPPRVAKAVERAMALDPEARFATAADMAAALGVAAPAAGDDDITIVATGVAAAAPDATTVMPAAPPEPTPVERAKVATTEAFADPERARTIAIVAAAVCFVLFLLGGIALAASRPTSSASAGAPGRQLADGLRGIAASFTNNDGPAAAAAANGLRDLAPLVEKGKGGPEASALLAKLAAWRDKGELTPAAAERAAAIVRGVPGADANAFTPPTTAAPPPTAPPAENTNGNYKGKGKGHKGEGD